MADDYLTEKSVTDENGWNNNSNGIHEVLNYLEGYGLIIKIETDSKTIIATIENGIEVANKF